MLIAGIIIKSGKIQDRVFLGSRIRYLFGTRLLNPSIVLKFNDRSF